jgi:hypothetical protein
VQRCVTPQVSFGVGDESFTRLVKPAHNVPSINIVSAFAAPVPGKLSNDPPAISLDRGQCPFALRARRKEKPRADRLRSPPKIRRVPA